jgi:hypothetical protein
MVLALSSGVNVNLFTASLVPKVIRVVATSVAECADKLAKVAEQVPCHKTLIQIITLF